MTTSVSISYWDYWLPGIKVDFDGVAKTITVAPGVNAIDIRTDIYSRWVDWVLIRDNLKYEGAIRVAGYDPIPSGFTGDVYFLTNGWKLKVDLANVRITGVLFSDNYDTAYYTPEAKPQYPASVAALVNTVINTQNIITGEALTMSQIAAAVRTELSIEMSRIDNSISSVPNAVWNKNVTEMTDKTTIGGYISKLLLTIPKFLGLK